MFDNAEHPELTPLAGNVRRTSLTDGAWVDHLPGWLLGSEQILDALVRELPWRAERRQMYDREVDVPRLLCWYSEPAALPHPVLQTARTALNEYYAPELGEPFATAGLCLYRDGADSVAWHGDRIGRGAHSDTMVAILSVGSARALHLRRRRLAPSGPIAADGAAEGADAHGGRPTHLTFNLGHGDLLVMGGSCQRTWEHAIPKTALRVGRRVSIQFRPVGVA